MMLSFDSDATFLSINIKYTGRDLNWRNSSRIRIPEIDDRAVDNRFDWEKVNSFATVADFL